MPAQNAGPLPVRMTHRAAGSFAAWRNAAVRDAISSRDSAFRLSGRFMVMSAADDRSSYFTMSFMAHQELSGGPAGAMR
jgi:hypothetical protein